MINTEIFNMPKIVLHLHLDGSLRPETVQRWLQEEGDNEELTTVKEQLMVQKGCKDLNEYLQKFKLPLTLLQTKEHIEQASFELFEDLAKQNVIGAEVRFAPQLHTIKGLSYEEIVEAAIRGMNSATKKYGIIASDLILCCMRGDKNHEDNLKTVEVAKKYLGKGVGAIDLAGAEAVFKTKNFQDVFSIAKENKIPFTIHAGEADGPESINTALDFGATRIGHGVRAIQDEETMKRLKVEGIILEVCPISNEQTQAVAGTHPLEELYNYGLKTTISSDNDTVSNTNICEDLQWVLDNTRLTLKDLRKMQLNGARGMFVNQEIRKIVEHKLIQKEIESR